MEGLCLGTETEIKRKAWTNIEAAHLELIATEGRTKLLGAGVKTDTKQFTTVGHLVPPKTETITINNTEYRVTNVDRKYGDRDDGIV